MLQDTKTAAIAETVPADGENRAEVLADIIQFNTQPEQLPIEAVEESTEQPCDRLEVVQVRDERGRPIGYDVRARPGFELKIRLRGLTRYKSWKKVVLATAPVATEDVRRRGRPANSQRGKA